jgi:hypothetical protein
MPIQNAVLSRDHPMPDEEPPEADDLSALRLLVLPDLGPPFDDAPAAGAIVAAEAGTPGLSWSNRDCAATAATADTAATAPTAATSAEAAQARADSDWARQFALLLCEALAGARPVRQILPWTTERARLKLDRLRPLFGGGQRPRVLRVIITRPARDVIEMTVVVGLQRRTRALAVRLERTGPADQSEQRDQPAWLKQAARSRPHAQPGPPAPPAQPGPLAPPAQPGPLAQPAQPGPLAQPGPPARLSRAPRAPRAPRPAAARPRWVCTAVEAA